MKGAAFADDDENNNNNSSSDDDNSNTSRFASPNGTNIMTIHIPAIAQLTIQ